MALGGHRHVAHGGGGGDLLNLDVSAMSKSDLRLGFGQWQRLDEVLPKLFERMGYNDGGAFITANWDCKYIDARIDMRTGAVYLKPGNGDPPSSGIGAQIEAGGSGRPYD